MKQYQLESLKEAPCISDSRWETISALSIECFPWQEFQYHPETMVKAALCPSGLVFRYETKETPVLARFRRPNSMVCLDSCMELFFCPQQSDRRYFNLEFNPFGTMLCGLGASREDRCLLNPDQGQFGIETLVTETGWTLRFFIPFSFVETYFTKMEFPFRANFYKCAEEVSRPHFGCWNEVKTPDPDFHQSDFFGLITLK